jgi:hypothetical protein
MAWVEGATMSKKRSGRPKSSIRKDTSIKFDKTLAGLARLISQARGISMAEYLSEMCRPHLEHDYAEIMKAFREGK